MHMQVRSERKAGNLARAHKASRSAYVWVKSASVAGVTIYITAAIFGVVPLAIGVLIVIIAVICLC